MYKKTCHNCYQPSFSSRKSGEWICPICRTDLITVKLRDAEYKFSGNSTKNQINLQKRYLKQDKSDSNFTTYI
ncbi:hypothetical protein GH741_18290 [Aquibacillus halophilus]|uniref:Uncharacterized protein n=1 Tax=Aquibacillus halophilus TaxID=930132 RepID=A0A6A8DLG3_9BACI|nr:Sjogren's syndrome/scleroderma autoantigen 1 family protein [Aquibacillus halophilus]MRH44599.1 hypothetical protein [Aquibacillus halophilus]